MNASRHTLILLLPASITLANAHEQEPTPANAYITQRGKPTQDTPPTHNEVKSVVQAEQETYKELFEKANQLLTAHKTDEAILYYKKAVDKNAALPQAYFNMGIAYERLDDTENAITTFEKAIQYHPTYAKAHYHLGKQLHKKKDYDRALNHLNLAVQHDAQLFDAYVTMARIELDRERFSRAVDYLKKAHHLRPDNGLIAFELANTLNTINKTEDALALYYKLLEKNPNDTAILYNTAYTLKKLGKLREAMPFYKATLERKPDHCEAHFSLGLAHLIGGDFEKGWEEYEWRWKRDKQLTPRNFKQPTWDGSDLQGKTILLHAEQGLGDTLQFIRYAQVVKQYNATVIVAVQKPLVTLISHCPYIDQVVTLRDQLPSFDVQAPLMSLPFILKTRQDTVPQNIPYLHVPDSLIQHWRAQLSHDKNFKIGICWQGNSNYSTPFLRAVVAAKSVTLNKFSALSKLSGVSIYSLQKQTGTDQLKTVDDDFTLYTFEGDFDDSNGRFMDTCAVIKNLDLVITIDTSISHLAAGLGAPTWILIPNPPDWRWMLDRTDTPWYPNMRLFRQPTPGDWDSVLEEIVNELMKLLSQGGAAQSTVAQDLASPSSGLITQLQEELYSIDNQLGGILEMIQGEKTTALDPETINNMRQFYLLSEMRNTLYDKITMLQKKA